MAYASLEQLYTLGAPLGVLDSPKTPAATHQQSLEQAASRIDMYLRARYALPLQAPFDAALVEANCIIASYMILGVRGFDPNRDALMIKRYDDAIALLVRVERQAAHFSVIEAVAPSPALAAPLIVSQPQQGWIPCSPPGSGFTPSGIS